jgi:hypothetical protein
MRTECIADSIARRVVLFAPRRFDPDHPAESEEEDKRADGRYTQRVDKSVDLLAERQSQGDHASQNAAHGLAATIPVPAV